MKKIISTFITAFLVVGCTTTEAPQKIINQEETLGKMSLEDKAHFVIGTGMGPIYPAIQHMAPSNFGKRYSAAVIGLQMASAYVGSTFMPMVFGHLQQAIDISVMPMYLLVFAVLNLGMLEIAYRRLVSVP